MDAIAQTHHAAPQLASLMSRVRDAIARRLVEAAGQLACVAAAIEPASRRAWAARARQAIAPAFDTLLLSHEAAVATIAIEWVGASSFATDGLLRNEIASEIDLLVVV